MQAFRTQKYILLLCCVLLACSLKAQVDTVQRKIHTRLEALASTIELEVPKQSAAFYEGLYLYDSIIGEEPTPQQKLFSLYYHGEDAYYNSDYPKAIECYQLSADIASKHGFTLKLADAQQNIGLCYHFMGDFNQAFHYYHKAAREYQILNKFQDLANAYQNIGIVYNDWERYEESVKFYHKALAINDSLGNENRVAALYQNIGVVYYYWEHYHEALKYYNQSFDLYRRLKDIQGVGSAYINIAVVYESMDNLTKALEYYEKAYITLEKFDQPNVIAHLLTNLANIYLKQNNTGAAINYLNQALDLAQTKSLHMEEAEVLKLLSLAYEQSGNYRQALEQFQQYHKLNDSLFSAKQQREFDEIVASYELKAKETRIENLEYEKETAKAQLQKQQQFARLGALMALSFLILMSTALYFYFRKRKLVTRLNNEIKAHKRTSEKLEHIKQELEEHVHERTEQLWKTNHQLKEAVKKYEHTVQQLQEAKMKAEEANKLKSSFLGNMSHEVRTPLNAILGFSQMLTFDHTPEKRTEYVTFIEEASQNLLHIIEDLLDFSKLESGRVHLNVTQFKPNEVLLPLEAKFTNQLKLKPSKLVSLSFSCNCDEQCIIEADLERTRQLLSIFIDNAIKFTPSGEVHVKIEQVDEHIRFVCKDTGIGISADNQEVIFEQFRQLDSGTTRKFGGNGLGLSMAVKVARLLKTEIYVDSEEGVGSTFSFSLPYNIPVGQNDKDVDVYDFTGKHLLIAEDKPVNYHILEEYLKDTHVTLSWAQNGAEAVELVTKKTFDAVLMDIQMPVMDGIEATEKIREISNAVPVIAQTAYAFSEDAQKCLKAGCNDIITKPIVMHVLFEKLQTYLFPEYA